MEVHLYLLLFLSTLVYSNPQQALKPNNTDNGVGIIGAIVDNTSRVGKEDLVAIQMAIEDFCNLQNHSCPAFKFMNSQGQPDQAALVARQLMKNEKDVQVILGPRSWEETASVAAEVVSHHNNNSNIPILSLSDSTPSWATRRWPFLFQASPTKNSQMKAIAAVIESFRWRRVNVIYENLDSFSTNGIIIPLLHHALQEVGAQISNLIPLSPLFTSSELIKLKGNQCRVFVVHVSLPLGVTLFRIATEMKMMEKGYVWITTDTVTNHVHYLNSSVFSTMQGVLGVKSYYDNKNIEFHQRFEDKFGSMFPREKSYESGSFAVEAYDAAWAAALAVDKLGKGEVKVENLFSGLKREKVNVFQIINVFGKSHRELGFWSDIGGIGFFDHTSMKKGTSMDIFGQIFWPGGLTSVPRGWKIPSLNCNPLKIGVPNNSMNNRFVKVTYSPSWDNYSFSGFSIDVFTETVKRLPYFLPYTFIPFNGTYSELVENIRLKVFDAAVGDIAIVSQRFKNADFTHPHTESGMVLVVPMRSQSEKAWLFLKPFTKAMWLLTISINTYNGLVVWLIERNHYSDLKGSSLTRTRTILLLAFGSLFSFQGEGLRSNLSRMATAVWLVVALIISQSYTASLTSMLTVPRLEARVSDIGALLRDSNSLIGYSRNSFVRNYLLDVLHFNEKNIRNFSTIEDTAEALKGGEIAAAFLELSTAKLLVAKYCKNFRITGPMYKIGGYGYAFPKGSPLVSDIDEALMKVFEGGVLKELEDTLTASEKCVDSENDDNSEILSISPSSFYVLFAWSVATSTAALAFYAIHTKCGMDMVVNKALKHWEKKKRIFSRKLSYAENPAGNFDETDHGSHFAMAA